MNIAYSGNFNKITISYLIFLATIRESNSRSVQTLVQPSEGYTSERTRNGSAQSNKAYVTTTATTTQSDQSGKTNENTRVKSTHSVQSSKTQNNTTERTTPQPAQFSKAQTVGVRTTQSAQFTEAKVNTTVKQELTAQ